MIVLSDSSPLITLAKVGCLDLLPALYKTITITPQVYTEVVVSGAGLAGSSQISEATWIVVQRTTDLASPQEHGGLGAGELSIISLARELKADLVLIDDRDARRAARQQGLAVFGCVGILHEAFDRKLLSDLPDSYRRLLACGAYIDPAQLEGILRTRNLPPL